MTEFDAAVVLSAGGVLARFNTAGILGAADVHTAIKIGELYDEPDERVRLAAALAVRALRGGSVCIDVLGMDRTAFETDGAATELEWPEPSAWLDAVRRSPAVADGPDAPGGKPLRLVNDLLYLERYWQQEESVREQLRQRQQQHPGRVETDLVRRTLDALFNGGDLPTGEPDLQRLAAAVIALGTVSVIAGGPGTGKTTTVAKALALLTALAPVPPTIALAAPTGKAAARLEEAVRRAAGELGDPWRHRIGELEARTLHRLLGWTPSRTRFRHNADNPLPHDVVVVDELSMVSLTMMARLLEAVRPDARLILVGDPDQLASVEAGAVLADITRAGLEPNPGLTEPLAAVAAGDRPAPGLDAVPVVTLQHTWRFDGGIDTLARAIRAGDAEAALEVLRAGTDEVGFTEVDLTTTDPGTLGSLRHRVVDAGAVMRETALAGDAGAALSALDRHRLLCAHRNGPFGVTRWGWQAVSWLQAALPDYGGAEWYAGLPIMVTANDPDAGLYNGDTGVLVQTRDGGLRAAFARGGAPMLYSTIQLDAVTPVHAMTVHKSQGSQFETLSFIAPPPESLLLTRELLYTAITRASKRVEIYGSLEAIRAAIERPANRASGLAGRLR